MIEEAGKVIEKEAGYAWVATMRLSACESCSAKAGCGQNTLSKLLSPEASHIRAIDPLGVPLGNQVIIGIPENTVMTSSLLMYFMPLVFMLAAAMAAAQSPLLLLFPSEDITAAVGGGVGFLLGLAIVRWHGVKNKHNTAFQAVILREQIPDGATPICFEKTK